MYMYVYIYIYIYMYVYICTYMYRLRVNPNSISAGTPSRVEWLRANPTGYGLTRISWVKGALQLLSNRHM